MLEMFGSSLCSPDYFCNPHGTKLYFSDTIPNMNKELYPVLSKKDQEHVERNDWDALIIKCDNMGGEGVFAQKDIGHATMICHYGGNLIEQATAEDDMAHGRTKFLLQFTVNGQKLFFNHPHHSVKTYGRMMNHSKLHPNCTKKLHQNASGMPVIMLKTLRKIDAGEELVHDYGVYYESIPPCTVNCKKCFGKEIFGVKVNLNTYIYFCLYLFLCNGSKHG